MKISESAKDWFKALGLFWAGYLVSAYVIVVCCFAAMFFTGAKINWIVLFKLPVPVTVMAFFSFLIFWGWFRFRTGMKLDSLKWKARASAGFAMLPLLTIFSLPLVFLGVIAMAPVFFNIVLPVFILLVVSEGASWYARIKAHETATSQGKV